MAYVISLENVILVRNNGVLFMAFTCGYVRFGAESRKKFVDIRRDASIVRGVSSESKRVRG